MGFLDANRRRQRRTNKPLASGRLSLRQVFSQDLPVKRKVLIALCSLGRPKIVAELNGQEVKLVKFQGVFPWYHHQG